MLILNEVLLQAGTFKSQKFCETENKNIAITYPALLHPDSCSSEAIILKFQLFPSDLVCVKHSTI